jgi:3-dehydroshikimate dehydratase
VLYYRPSRGQTKPAQNQQVLAVTKVLDDGGAGTLRWAIEKNNVAPGHYRIEIEPEGNQPGVIILKSALPPIKGPVQIEGMPWKKTGRYVAVDGSGYIPNRGIKGCPGALPGQYGTNVRTMTDPGLQLVDTEDVEISGLEIRNFCIGVLINRASGNLIHDNRIVANHGGAGVMLTGDDGHGNPTSTTTIHNKVLRNEFVDNGDGLELTRGAAFNLVADNVFQSTNANPEPSQGIEILRGNDNFVVENRFEGYSDGLQVNWGNRNFIASNELSDNTFGLSLTGIGNIVDSNRIHGNAVGIAVRPAEPSTMARLSRNQISDNGKNILRCNAGGSCDPKIRKGGIVLGLPGLEHDTFVGSRGGGVKPDPSTLLHICPHDAPNCEPAPNGGIMSPMLASAKREGGKFLVTGDFTGAPQSRYLVELFGNREKGSAEGEVWLADEPVVTDGKGRAHFSLTVNSGQMGAPISTFTATATSAEGGTSELSRPVQVAN